MLALAGCSTAGDDVFAPVFPPTTLASLVVAPRPTITVSGPGISGPLLFYPGGPGTDGRYALPLGLVSAGPARSFVARSFHGTVTSHIGAATADLTGASGSLGIVLRRPGSVVAPTALVESVTLALDDASTFAAAATTTSAGPGSQVSLSVKATYTFSLIPLHLAGDPVSGAVVTWGSDDATLVRVGSLQCTTAADGTCTITATVATGAATGQSARVAAQLRGSAAWMRVTVP